MKRIMHKTYNVALCVTKEHAASLRVGPAVETAAIPGPQKVGPRERVQETGAGLRVGVCVTPPNWARRVTEMVNFVTCVLTTIF